MRRSVRAAAAALAAALLGAACATLGAILPLRIQSAEDRSSELRLLPPSAGRPLGGAALRLWARVQNPNPLGLTLREIEGELHVEDAEAIVVEFPLGLPLAAYGDTVVPLDVSIGLGDVPRLASVARAAVSGQPLGYRVDGTFGVDAGARGTARFGPLTLLRGDLRIR